MNASQTGSGKYQWWRWPLMPFAAFLGAAVGAAAFFFLQWIGMKITGGFYSDGWIMMYILPFVSAMIGGWIYGYLSCTVAPSAKVVSGIVMTSILGVLVVLGLAATWASANYATGYKVLHTVLSITNFVAAVVAVKAFHFEHGWDSRTSAVR